MYQLYREQKLNCSVQELWEFISSPRNLQDVTPDGMGFKITSAHLPEKMYPGMMVAYLVAPFMGIKMKWVTEITHVEDQHFFIDEQRIGPYSLWHHEHRIHATDDGGVMSDLVCYVLPFGFLGRWVHALFIRKKLEAIFDFREKMLAEMHPFTGR